MFDQVKEDILVMVDGDDTYDAGHVHKLLEPILRGDADMTVATRLTNYGEKSFRPLHVAGNRLVCGIINWMFQSQVSDIFSGYRVFTREAALQIPSPPGVLMWKPNSRCRRFTAGWSSKNCRRPTVRGPRKLFQIEHGVRRVSRHPEAFPDHEILQAADLFWNRQPGAPDLGLVVGSRPVYEYITERYVHAVPSAMLAASLVMLAFFSLGLV